MFDKQFTDLYAFLGVDVNNLDERTKAEVLTFCNAIERDAVSAGDDELAQMARQNRAALETK